MKLNYYTKQKIIIGIVLGSIILLEAIYIYYQAELIAVDSEYSELQEKLQQEKRARLLLNEERYYAESLQVIEGEARRRGFVPARYVYLP